MDESWLEKETVATKEEQPSWLEKEPDATVTVAPWVSASEKQERVQQTIAEMKANRVDQVKSLKAFRLSQDEGLPMDVAYRQADQFVKKRKPAEWDNWRANSPAAARLFAEGDYYQLFSDEDIAKLGPWERAQKQLSMQTSQNTEGLEMADIGFRMLRDLATKQDESRFYEIKNAQSARPEFSDSNVVFGMGVIDQAVKSTGQSMIRSWPQALMGAASGAAIGAGAGAAGGTVVFPGAGTATGAAGGAFVGGIAGAKTGFKVGTAYHAFEQVSGMAYSEVREMLDENGEQLDDDLAKGVAYFTGVVGGATELLSLKAFAKSVPGLDRLLSKQGLQQIISKAQGSPVMRNMLVQFGKAAALAGTAEGLQEVAELAGQIGGALFVGAKYDNQGNRIDDQLEPENVATTFGWGAVGGIGISAGLQTGTAATKAAARPVLNFARNRAEAKRESLVQMGDAIRGLSVTQSAPEALKAYAAELDKDSPSAATAPADALSRLFQEAGLTNADVQTQFPELGPLLNEAAETGAEVTLSNDTLIKMQALEKTAYDEFANDVRLGPEEMTAREATVEAEGLDEMISSMSEEDQTKAVEASLVEETSAQLVEAGTEAGAARKQAKLLVAGQMALAKRSGMTVQDLAARYKVEIASGQEAGPDAMQQQAAEFDTDPVEFARQVREAGGDITQTPAFQNWFGDSKVVDEQGKPQVMYHGTSSDFSSFGRVEGGNAYGAGFYFTSSPTDAASYATGEGMGRIAPEGNVSPNIMPVFLKMERPYEFGNSIVPLEEIGAIEAASNSLSPGMWKQGELKSAFDSGYQATRDNVAQFVFEQTGQSYPDLLKAAGYDGIIANMGTVVFDPTQIKSVNNRGTFDTTSPNILFQSAAPLQSQPLQIVGTGRGGRILNKDLGQALTDRHMATYGRTLDPANEADYQVMLSSVLQDYAEQKSQPDNGEAWYSDDINEAIRITTQVIESLDDKSNRDMFLTLTALLSPQQKPGPNWENAILAMSGYLDSKGTIPLVKPNGKKFGVNTSGLQLMQHLVDTMTLEGALQWVQEPHTGKEMAEVRRDSGLFVEKEKLAGYLPNEINQTETQLGIYMFGPKVGDFMQNSVGIDQDAVTVDLWMARTYNRFIGRLLDTPDGGLISDVRSKSERQHIKRLVRDAAAEVGIDPSAMQAALWYFEQRLYRNHGIKADSENFSGAARTAASKRGIEVSDIGEGSQGERRGNRSGRTQSGSLAPLEGSPQVEGATGPDPALVAVAEQYARQNGIDLKRQAEFVQVDPDRAARIAEAYDAMPHAPDDPAVVEAYENLITQTLAQYEALTAAGYKFWFFDPFSEYGSSPWNAMRDLRANKSLGVFPTDDGFGTSEADISGNPLLVDTGIQWPSGGPDGPLVRVTANDLFRAVHDAFGHGLEGAGFRARGEENAWQAHVRLFTGSAVGAITSETRGQNSWLNYGPHGESNRTAQVEDTVFADQKTGLMPEWTWTEGRAADEVTRLEQNPIFYSAVLKGVEAAKQPKAPAAQWKGLIKNMPGIKQEELDTLGIEEWLDQQDGSVTKEALADYIRANQLDVQEVVRGDNAPDPKFETIVTLYKAEILSLNEPLDAMVQQFDGSSQVKMSDHEMMVLWDRVEDEALAYNATPIQRPEEGDVVDVKDLYRALILQQKYLGAKINTAEGKVLEPRWEGQYISPGGENYGEIVITLPGQIEPYKPDDMHFTTEGGGTAVAWIRKVEHIGPNGERILLAGEVQSKRHQDGSKKGYAKKKLKLEDLKETPPKADEVGTDEKLWFEAPDGRRAPGWVYGSDRITAAEEALRQLNNPLVDGVPDAPFKTTWQELAMKRMLRYAVDNGFDVLAWDTGSTVVGHYDLRKVVENVSIVRDGPRNSVRATGKEKAEVFTADFDNDGTILEGEYKGKSLAEVFGEELAAKFLAVPVQGDGWTATNKKSGNSGPTFATRQEAQAYINGLPESMKPDVVVRSVNAKPSQQDFSGEDLEVGGEFLIKRYDKELPRYMAKLTKKWGGKVGKMEVNVGGDMVITLSDGAQVGTTVPDKSQEVWSLPITDRIREEVSKGLPMFQTGDEPRGFIEFTKARDKFTVTLTGNANLSTFLHESGHYFLEVMTDLVETGQGNVRMQEDLQMLRDWTGVGTNGKFTREHHEKFARAFEAYLMEGNAPSAGLRSLFNRFKGWLTFIYKTALSLNVELTDEVREVMDRLLASDEEIAKARRDVGRSDTPMDQETMGLSGSEYEQYIALWDASQEVEKARLDTKQMKEVRQGQKDSFKNEVQRNVEQMTAELEKTRGYQTWISLRDGEVKLDREALTPEQRKLAFGLHSAAGIDADTYAMNKGYDNGLDMLKDIYATRQQADAIPRAAKEKAEKDHGFMDVKGMEDAAQLAIHNEEQQEVALLEYMALTSRDGRKARKGFAAWINAQAKERVASLNRRQIDPTRWRRAEVNAAKKTGAALANGDKTAAALAKRQQLMASAMYRASLEANERIETIRKKLMPFNTSKRRARLGKAGPQFRDAIDEIMESVSLKRITGKEAARQSGLREMMAYAQENQLALSVPENMPATDYASLTLNDLETVHDVVFNIWQLAKKSETAFIDGKRVEFEAVMSEAERTAALMGTLDRPTKNVEGKMDDVRNGIRKFRASLVKPEFIFKWLDGTAAGGMLHKVLFQPFVDAQKAAYDLMHGFKLNLIDPMRAMPTEQRNRWAAKRTVFGNKHSNGATIISAALNLGNELNKSRLVKGLGLTEDQVMAEINAFMTKEDWDMVQLIWDQVDTLWPMVERTAEKATGLKPEKSPALPIQTPFGEYSGGYYPIVYDRRVSKLGDRMEAASDELFGNDFLRNPTLSNGFTKGRVQDVPGDNPLLLDMSVLSRHLGEVVHYVTHYEAVDQANRLLRRTRFKNLIKEHLGDEYNKTLQRWLLDIARNQDAPAEVKWEAVSDGLRWLRGGTSIATMGYNMFTASKQLLGLTTAMDAIPIRYVAQGISKMYLAPMALQKSAWAFAMENSKELRPLIKSFDRDVRMVSNVYAQKMTGKVVDKIVENAFVPMGYVQATVNVAVWQGAFDQAQDKGMTEAEAIDYADAIVRQTQGSGGIKDLSGVQRSSEGVRMMTMFYSWMSVMYNRLEDMSREQKRIGIRNIPRLAKRLTVAFMLTTMIEELGARLYDEAMGADDDDDDDAGYALTVLLKTGDLVVGTVPFFRTFFSFESAYRKELTPLSRSVDDIDRTMKALADLVLEGETLSRSEAKAAVRATSVATRKPAYGVYRMFDEWFGEDFFDK